MAQLKSEEAYQATMRRIEELDNIVDDNTPTNDPNYLELDMLIDLVEEYENIHYPMGREVLSNYLRKCMHDMRLSQKTMAEMLGISAPRMSEIINGNADPTLQTARMMCIKLDIPAEVVLRI